MDKLILQDVIESYALLRRENELEEARRLSEIQEKYPDIHRLLSQRHQMVLSSVRSVFSGKGEDPVRKMEDYNRQISDALVRAGYPADYLSPIHRCPVCQDAGYVYRDNKKEYCACLLKNYETAVREADQTASGVSFSSFDPLRFPETLLPGTDVSQREYMLLVKEKCMAYARQLNGGSVQTLLLHGGSGLGKTYLLHCIEREGAAMGISCVFCTAYDVLDALRQRYFGRENDLADAIENAQLLLIDDLGMEPLMENITVEQIYHLLSTRLSRGLYTAISTNLSRTELQKRYTERVSSRLLDVRSGMAIPFRGEDIRLKK